MVVVVMAESSPELDSCRELEIEADFKKAAGWMRRNKTLKLSTDQKLTLYGLFKQVSRGYM